MTQLAEIDHLNVRFTGERTVHAVNERRSGRVVASFFVTDPSLWGKLLAALG